MTRLFQYSIWVFAIFLLSRSGFCQQPIRITRNVEVTAAEEKVRDKLGYQAIIEIHRDMDDDHSGSIDRNESTGFMKEDMQMRGTERTRRENKFHGDDEAITVDDLWEAWFESEERSWTNERLVEWLTNDVNLPSIADVIKRKKLDGKVLPRFASPSADFLSKELGVKSTVFRQKLRLNSLDVVLFGYRDTSNRTKDVILGLLALLLTSLAFLYVRQKQKAQEKVNELHKRLKELKSMECEFDDVQKLLNDERSKRSTADGGASQKEMESLRYQLEEAERRLEANTNGSETPLALQPLLRRTCENEMSFLEKQRQECFKEMKDAIEMVDRLQKKQGSVLSSLKLATGAASTSDQVDSKIFALKSRMEKIHALTRETQERWMQIESLCGFPVLYVNETEHINRTISSNHFYNSHSGSSSVSGSLSNANQQKRKISAVSKANSVPANANIRFTTSKAKEPTSNGSANKFEEEDVDQENKNAQKSKSFEETVPETKTHITFQQNGNGKAIPEDVRSIQTTTSSSTVDTKKKRSILPKFLRKSTSKGSLTSNSTVASS